MQAMEYNDLWAILNRLDESEVNKLPEAYRDFIRECMVPDAESGIDPGISLYDQELSDKTKDLLASLSLTYWSKDTLERYELAKVLHENELKYQGKPVVPMTEEEYQNLLQVFDDWNDWFGPIPFWAASRRWEPRYCYETVTNGDEADIKAGDIGLREIYVTKKQRDIILGEAKEWVLVKNSHFKETLYWHDDDESEWDSVSESEDYYKTHVVIKDGHFIGALLDTTDTSSMGMSVNKSRDYGILFTDGTSAGKVTEYFTHSSSEVDRSEDAVYSLKRK